MFLGIPRHSLEEAAAVEVDRDIPGDSMCKAYGRLAKYFSEDPKIPEQLRNTLADHVASTPKSSELYGFFLHCYVAPTFNDRDLFLVELSVGPELRKFQFVVFQAMLVIGGAIKYLGPPPKQPERDAQSALRAFHSRPF